MYRAYTIALAQLSYRLDIGIRIGKTHASARGRVECMCGGFVVNMIRSHCGVPSARSHDYLRVKDSHFAVCFSHMTCLCWRGTFARPQAVRVSCVPYRSYIDIRTGHREPTARELCIERPAKRLQLQVPAFATKACARLPCWAVVSPKVNRNYGNVHKKASLNIWTRELHTPSVCQATPKWRIEYGSSHTWYVLRMFNPKSRHPREIRQRLVD